MTRRAARTDTNHAVIRETLRRAGLTVQDTARLGDGFPDLVCIHTGTGRVALVEVKTPGGDLSPDEVTLTVRLVSDAYRVVYSPEQAAQLAAELANGTD